MPDLDPQSQKHELARQQSWYATSTIAFIALVATVIRPANLVERLIFAPMLLLSMGAGIYMVVLCHQEYLRLDSHQMTWRQAFRHSLRERRGALFCITLIAIEGSSLLLILLCRLWPACSR